MSLESKVMDEMKTAMRAKDEVALRTLRAIKAAILIEKTFIFIYLIPKALFTFFT